MRIPGVRILMTVLMAAALPGCRPAERAVVSSAAREDPANVLVTRDTQVFHSGTTVTVTENQPEPPREHNDCRYVGVVPQARSGDPLYGERYDPVVMEAGVPFRCRLRADGPEVKLVVSGYGSVPELVDVHSPPDAPRPLQQLVLDNSESAWQGSELLIGEDLNRDGWMDLRVFTYSGTAGQMSDVFRYEPAARRFVPDTALPGMNVRRLPGERPCVGISTKAGAWDYSTAEYCWSGGTWVEMRSFSQQSLRGERVVRTQSERRGGRMQVVRLDTLPADAPDW
jgi:hypothetical protein